MYKSNTFHKKCCRQLIAILLKQVKNINKSQSEVSSSTFRVVTYKSSFTFLEFHYIMPKRYISRAQFNNLYASLNTYDLSNIIKIFYRVSGFRPGKFIASISLRFCLSLDGLLQCRSLWWILHLLLVLPKKRRRLVCQKKLTIPQNRFRYFSHVLVTVLTLHLLLMWVSLQTLTEFMLTSTAPQIVFKEFGRQGYQEKTPQDYHDKTVFQDDFVERV